jgi:hypothetical protein
LSNRPFWEKNRMHMSHTSSCSPLGGGSCGALIKNSRFLVRVVRPGICG